MIQQDSEATHKTLQPEGLLTSRRINYYLQAVEWGLFTFAAHSDMPMEFHVEFLISYFVCWTHKYTKLLYSGLHIKYYRISCIILRILKSQM